MARLLYMAITSLDGYVADEAGSYDWAMPDDEVFGFVNDFERPVGTYLYGRRLYQEMTGWATMRAGPGLSPLMLDFARIWQAADKVVYSRSLEDVSTARTRLERDFDPGAVREMKAGAERDITVGGAGVEGDLDGRRHVVAVLRHERQVGLDEGAEHARAGLLGFDPGPHVRTGPGDQLLEQLLDELVLAAEMVDDHPLARVSGLRDARQRSLPVSELGNGVDGGRHDLRPPGGLGERPARLLTTWTSF